MRSLLAATTGLLAIFLGACGAPEDGDGGGSDAPLPPLARAFEGTVKPWALATGPDADVFLTGTFAFDVDFGGGTLTAEPKGSVFIAHLDAEGQHLFSGSTGSGDYPFDVGIGPLGDLYVVGQFSGNINFGSGKMEGVNDAFFAAFEKGGASDHSFSAGGDVYADSFLGVEATRASIVFVAGRLGDDADLGDGALGDGSGMHTTLAAYDRDGEHLWERRFPGDVMSDFDIAADGMGNLFLAGVAWDFIDLGDITVPEGFFVMKLSPSGDPLWVRSAGTTDGWQDFSGLAVDGAGDVVVGAIYYGAFSFGGVDVPAPGADYGGFLARLSADGEVKHVKTQSYSGYVGGMFVGASKGGDAVVAVSGSGTVDFGTGPVGQTQDGDPDIVVGRYDAAGTLLGADRVPGTGAEQVWDLAMSGDSPVLLGTFNDTLTIGEETLTATNGNSLFVARLGQ